MKKQRTKTVIQTHEIITIREAQPLLDAWCADCSKRITMTTPEYAAAMMRVKVRVVYRLVECQAVHFVEDNQGALFICLDSLSGLQESRREET